MANLPLLSGQEVVKILVKFGYREIRQRGSHIRLACFKKRSVTVPNYDEISKGLLNKILRDAEISVEEFIKYK